MSCFSLFCQVNSQQGDEWRPCPEDPNNNPNMKGTRPQSSWEQGLPDVPTQAAIGHMHLSFEYHQNSLKVRVWQLTDLLLPPPQTSMIEAVFVRGYFIPDVVKKTNRRTEDVKVDFSSTKDRRGSNTPSVGIQHIFSPSSFRFETPLLYTGVTQEIVTERSLQLEVCMTQKHTRKAFLMAMVHMPLRLAVRRPIREKYPLIPCMNYTIPNTMRIYSARDIILEGAAERPSVSRSNSSQSSSSKGIELEEITTENLVRKCISVDTLDSDSDKDGNDDSDSEFEVKVDRGRKNSAAAVAEVSNDRSDTDSQNDLQEIIAEDRSAQSPSTVVDMGNDKKPRIKKKIIPNELLTAVHDDGGSKETKKEEEKEDVSTTIVEIEKESVDTVVDMSRLQEEIVIKVDSDSEETASSPGQKPSPKSKRPESQKAKKKIIPLELGQQSPDLNGENHAMQGAGRDAAFLNDSMGKDRSLMDRSCESGYSSTQSITPLESEDVNSARFLSPQLRRAVNTDKESEWQMPSPVHSSSVQGDGSSWENDDMPEEDEISKETLAPRLLSASDISGSPIGSGSTPVSRPETPIWDYYDFAAEEGASEVSGESAGTKPGAGTNGSNQGKTGSTLQESLARLSRPQPTLDTCLVAGPVLPSVMIDDFEMDES